MLNAQFLETNEGQLINVAKILAFAKPGGKDKFMAVLSYDEHGHEQGIMIDATTTVELRLWLQSQTEQIMTDAMEMGANMTKGMMSKDGPFGKMLGDMGDDLNNMFD